MEQHHGDAPRSPVRPPCCIGSVFIYHLDEKQNTSAVAQLTGRLSTNENTLTVGGLYTATLAALFSMR
ncbi:hypothetical protein ACP70R_017237 [Stipagrostis hirtigluma subsp. patula]